MVRRQVDHTSRRYSAADKPINRCTTGDRAMRRDESIWGWSEALMCVLRGCFRIEQTMQMHDEVTHLRVVDGLLRLRPPRHVGLGVIRIDADKVDLVEILEFDTSDVSEFAAQHEMQQLLRLSFAAHRGFLRSPAGSGTST